MLSLTSGAAPQQSINLLIDGTQLIYLFVIQSRCAFVSNDVYQIVELDGDLRLDHLLKCWLDRFKLLAGNTTPLHQNVTLTDGLKNSIQELGQSFLLAVDAETWIKKVFDCRFGNGRIAFAEKGSVVKDFRRRAYLKAGSKRIPANLVQIDELVEV